MSNPVSDTPSSDAVTTASPSSVASNGGGVVNPANPAARAAPVEALLSRTKPLELKRAPSLSELVQTMRTQNPDKWKSMETQASTSSPTANTALAPPSTSNTPLNGTSPGGDGPRLRLPARLAAQAPLLSRSHSSNAIVQSSPAGTSLPGVTSLPIHLAASPARGGLPSLEAIEKRFASKIQDNAVGKQIQTGFNVKVSHPEVDGRASLGVASSSAMARSKSDGNAPSPTAASFNVPKVPTSESKKASTSASTAIEKKDEPMSSVKTPTSATSSSISDEMKAQEHPLEHNWTLYYDSRATAKAAQLAKAKTQPPVSATHPTAAGGHANYEAGLSTIGTFSSVQSFCRLFNWTKRPSRMGMNENLHLFKDGIMPMWEDERNANGGKWTFQIDTSRREDVDRFWTWLCLAMIGEDFEDNNDEICGAVMSTRPRWFRIQVWVRNKDAIEPVNNIGKRLLSLLELDQPGSSTSSLVPTPTCASFAPGVGGGMNKPSPLNPNAGISLDFSYHSKGSPPNGRFISLVSTSASHESPMMGSAGVGPGSAFGSFGVPGNKILTPTSTFNRPPPGLAGQVGGMTRAASMSALSGGAKGGFQSAIAGRDQNVPPVPVNNGGGAMNWRERLGQPAKKPLAA